MGVARSRGSAAEALAAAYLDLTGCRVVERNVRVGGVEIDVVALDGETRVLVEVKYRGRADFGGAAAALDWRQRDRLLRAAAVMAARGERVRVDVVAIETEEHGAILRHYRHAVDQR
jgi:putative endonuclease